MSIHRTEPAAPPAGEHLPALAQWVERAMELAVDFGVESLRLGSRERRDAIFNNGVYGYDTVAIREKREVARATLRAHLSALPVAPLVSEQVFCVHNKTTNMLFATRADAEAFVSTMTATVGMSITPLPVLRAVSAPLAERPQGERQEDSFNQPVNDAQGASPASRSRAPSGEESAPTEPNDSQNSKESHYGKD